MKTKRDFVRQNADGDSVHHSTVCGIAVVAMLSPEDASRVALQSDTHSAESGLHARFADCLDSQLFDAQRIGACRLFSQRLSQIGMASSPNCVADIHNIWLSSHSRIFASFTASPASQGQRLNTIRSALISRRHRDLHKFNSNPVVPRIPR